MERLASTVLRTSVEFHSAPLAQGPEHVRGALTSTSFRRETLHANPTATSLTALSAPRLQYVELVMMALEFRVEYAVPFAVFPTADSALLRLDALNVMTVSLPQPMLRFAILTVEWWGVSTVSALLHALNVILALRWPKMEQFVLWTAETGSTLIQL